MCYRDPIDRQFRCFVLHSLTTFIIFMHAFLQRRLFVCKLHKYLLIMPIVPFVIIPIWLGAYIWGYSVTCLFIGCVTQLCAAIVGYFVNAVLNPQNLVPCINSFNIFLELLTFLLPLYFSYISCAVMWQFCSRDCRQLWPFGTESRLQATHVVWPKFLK